MFSTTRLAIKVLVTIVSLWLAIPYLQSLRHRRNESEKSTECTYELPGLYISMSAHDADTDRHDSRDIERKTELLDDKYVPRLITNTHEGDTAYQSIPGGEDIHPDTSYSAAIVIGRLTKEQEKVQWVYDKLIGVEPHIYIVDDNTTSEPHLQWNHGWCDD